MVQSVRGRLEQTTSPDGVLQSCGVQVSIGQLPADKDGAYIESERKIVINRDVTSEERRQFTLYHELVHHLIREDKDLYSYLHDTYADTDQFDKTIELLCNIGAAEFIIPQECVRELIETSGFSLSLVPLICDQISVSGPAALIQLIQCAPHSCYGVICEIGISPIQINPSQTALFQSTQESNLFIRYAIWSPAVRYSLSRWTLIPREHILTKAVNEKGIVKGRDNIPFRSEKEWVVPCEALFFRNCVYGLFNETPPPNQQQLRLL
jgi:hypothetical protein